MKVHDKLLMTDAERAEALADVFEANHSVTINERVPREMRQATKRSMQILNNGHMEVHDPDSFMKPKELKAIIRRLPNNKAPRPDGIRSEMLKNCSRKTIVALIHTQCLHNSFLFFDNVEGSKCDTSAKARETRE